MDVFNIYYTALVLELRIKGDLLLAELEDEVTDKDILEGLCKNIHQNYSVNIVEQSQSGPVVTP